jgi:predicted nucleic acid-binding protein
MARLKYKEKEDQIDKNVFIVSENTFNLFEKKDKIVLDTSVLIKWFFKDDEEHTGIADLILKRYLKNEIGIIVPELALFEITNVIKNKIGYIKNRNIPSEIIDRIFNLGIIFYINKEILKNALNIAIRTDESVYDCIFIATARYFNARMITDDRSLFLNYTKSKGGMSKKSSNLNVSGIDIEIILLQDYS